MTTIIINRATVEQALEALEEACEIIGAAWAWRDEKGKPTITALRAALAQQAEPVEPVAWYYERDTDKGLSFAPDRDPYKCWQPLYTAPPQQAEPVEPVAKVIATAPKRIWLDLGFDPADEEITFDQLFEATWSQDNATGWGIEYVRADLAQQAEPMEPVLQGPVAWRYWKQKWNCWEYSDTKLEFPAVPAGTKMEPLYLVSPEVKPERPPVGTVHKSVKGGVVWNRWPDEMEDGTHLYVNPPPCQTCEAFARTVLMDQMGRA